MIQEMRDERWQLRGIVLRDELAFGILANSNQLSPLESKNSVRSVNLEAPLIILFWGTVILQKS